MTAAAIGALPARRPALAAGAVLALTWIVTLTLPPWSNESVSDLDVRIGFADLMLAGELPYRDFPFEYPPLAAPAIALPALLGPDYRLAIAGVTLAATGCVLLLVRELAARSGGGVLPAMLAVALAPLLIGAVVRLHLDAIPVALTLGALLALLTRRPALGLALVGLGTMTKAFPIVAAPVALAWLWGSGDRRGAVRAAAALAITLAALAGASAALSLDGALEAVRYQAERPLQLESSPASALLTIGSLGGEDPMVVESHRSAGLTHPLEAPVRLASTAALGATVGLLALLAARRARSAAAAAASRSSAAATTPGNGSARALVLAALAAVAAFAALGPVLSPQYLVWIVPLLALSLAWGEHALTVACAAACTLTLVEFPSFYLDLVAGEPAGAAITAARNAALVAAVALAGAALARALPAPRPTTAGASHAQVTPGAGAPARSIAPVRQARPR